MLAPVFPKREVWAVAAGGRIHDYFVDVANTSHDIKCHAGPVSITLTDSVPDDNHSAHAG